jgi:hypothetical protein
MESMVGSIQDQVLAHDGQTNQAKITTGFGMRGWADIDAGQSRSKVSKQSLSIKDLLIDILQELEDGYTISAGDAGRTVAKQLFNSCPDMHACFGK